MLDSIFTGLFSSSGELTLTTFLISMAAALVLGAILALVSSYRSQISKSFAVTLAILPAIVSVVIMMVSGSIGAGVAVAGTFSLVRFRSAPGTAKEIVAIFLAMAVGLACGMGYPGFAAVFTAIMSLVSILYARSDFGERRNAELMKTVNITVPEELEYGSMFDDLFDKYTASHKLVKVKTTNLGSLNRLTYNVTLKRTEDEKKFIDELRCRNGNLEISSALQGTETQL